MADDKKGRNEQARNKERRQRERELTEARERGDEAEPAQADLDDLEEALESRDYPLSTEELVEDYGDREIQTVGDWYSVEQLLAPVDDETYESAEDVRDRIQRLVDSE